MHPTKKLKIFALAAVLLIAPLAVFAAYTGDTGLGATGSAAGLETTEGQLPVIIGTVIKTALGLVGVIFLVLMVYAGYIWMIARGDEGKVDKAKSTLTNAIIGIVIVVGAYALTNYIVNALTKPSGAAGAAANPVATCTHGGAECQTNQTNTICSGATDTTSGTCVAP